MDIVKYIGIKYNTKYTTTELNNILTKFNDLDFGKFYMTSDFAQLFRYFHVSVIINFINIFRYVDQMEGDNCGNRYRFSLAGNIIYMLTTIRTKCPIYMYKIMDHLLKLNMNTTIICTEYSSEYGIEFYDYRNYHNKDNYYTVTYILATFYKIQNVRKIMNNYDIILFDITDDLPFIELLLLITKCKNKIIPKFVITHKILYYYLLNKNIEYKSS